MKPGRIRPITICLVLDEGRLYLVVIATPNNGHRNQAVAAAAHKVHVIVEKPLAVTNFEA
mgnify:CR=1 FL=1